MRQFQQNAGAGFYSDALGNGIVNIRPDDIRNANNVDLGAIYHEMLHDVCPPYVDDNGVNRVHNKTFKINERQFKDYARAQRWLKENHKFFFEA